MASRRMVPTRFFKDPDIMNLSNKDTQLILIGLILAADDEGREVAHAGLLGREMDYPSEQIEAALQELVANDLLRLYQVGKHRYYQLVRWDEWQTLGNKKTPSKHPAPPDGVACEEARTDRPIPECSRISQKNARKIQENPAFPGKTPSQLNQNESKLSEEEGEGGTRPTCEPEYPPRNVVPFPNPRDGSANDGSVSQNGKMLLPAGHAALTQQVARILKVPVTEALTRLVAEYMPCSSLSLLGEADAAREWIDDPRRNKKRKLMSPAFFRSWLKRELEAVERRHQELQTLATGTVGEQASAPTSTGGHAPRPPDLMHLADEDARIGRAARSEHTKGDPR